MAITRVQGNARGTTTTNTISVTMDATPTSGNILVAVIGLSDAAYDRSVSSISETGVTWTKQISKLAPMYCRVEIWFGVVAAGVSVSITVNLAGTQAGATADVCEYSGVLTANFLDKTATSSGSSATPVTGTTATTTQASELWIGGTVSVSTSDQTTPINGFALLDGVVSNGISTAFLEYIASATGTANSGTTVAGAAKNYAGCIATFFAAAVGGISIPVAMHHYTQMRKIHGG